MGDHPGEFLVVGGGIIGLSAAWRLAQAGGEVVLLDPAPASGATAVAAGMLAPVTEAHYGEEELLALNLESRAAWPSFAAELEAASGESVGYNASGTLAIGYDPSDKAALDELHRFQQKLSLESTPLTASACRRLEPALSPAIRGGLDVPGDHQVDPRRVASALLGACREAGVVLERTAAARLLVSSDRAIGVAGEDGREFRAATTVLAAGWRSGELTGLPEGLRPPVRPVKGQLCRLRLDERVPRPARTLRALVRGSFVYLVPREDGELVCGATSEEMGTDRRVTAGAVYQLLRDAQAILPSILEAELVETLAGFRPGSPDNAPLVGPSGLEGLVLATGHFRHGILLAPVTAAIVVELISSGLGEGWQARPALDPRRFTRRRRP